MGFWGDVLGIGGDIAGAAIGMPWLGSAATAVGNAITGSQAATSAARTQQQGAQQAAALEQPAITVGQGALARLGSLYGLATGPAGAIGNAAQAIATGVPSTTQPVQPMNPNAGVADPNAVFQKGAGYVDPNTLYGMAQPANASSYGVGA